MNPVAVLTRPEGRNDRLAARLNLAGIETLSLPALSLRPMQSAQFKTPLPRDYDLIVFVSGSAVRYYLDQLACAPESEPVWPESTLLATVGQASARPLYQARGVIHRNIVHPRLPDQQQDSEALWSILQPLAHQFKRVLIVRGETGRDWLGRQLEQAGACVHRLGVYRREPAIWSSAQTRLLKERLEQGGPIVCLLTSSEGVAAVNANIEAHGLGTLWERVRFVVIHARVARRLQSIGPDMSNGMAGPGRAHPQVVKICSPDEDAIFEAIVSVATL